MIRDSPERLEELYWEEELTLNDIAEMDSCAGTTISRRMDKYGIPKRDGDFSRLNLDICDDPDKLEEYYVVRGYTTEEIADMDGCGSSTVERRLKEHNISSRQGLNARTRYVCYCEDGNGYPMWRGLQTEDRLETVLVHQVLACMDHDPHEVFAEDTHVHHGADNHDSLPPVELPFANWEGNLEVMDAGEHTAHHMNKYYGNDSEDEDDPSVRTESILNAF